MQSNHPMIQRMDAELNSRFDGISTKLDAKMETNRLATIKEVDSIIDSKFSDFDLVLQRRDARNNQLQEERNQAMMAAFASQQALLVQQAQLLRQSSTRIPNAFQVYRSSSNQSVSSVTTSSRLSSAESVVELDEYIYAYDAEQDGAFANEQHSANFKARLEEAKERICAEIDHSNMYDEKNKPYIKLKKLRFLCIVLQVVCVMPRYFAGRNYCITWKWLDVNRRCT